MKSVDVTLLIQILNFFIAYWFLRRYVFFPAAQILEVEEMQTEQMQQLIKKSLQQRDNAETNKNLRMLQIKKTLQDYMPAVKEESDYNLGESHQDNVQEPVVLSEEEAGKIKKIISDSVSKVKI